MNNQRKNLNDKLMSGERQVQSDLNKIDKWHKWRYEQACQYVHPLNAVYDYGCGCGYGSWILSQVANSVVGIDDSAEAIQFASENWSNNNCIFLKDNVILNEYQSHVSVAFEIIEHLKSWSLFIDKLKKNTNKYIIFSVPHKSVPLKRSSWHWHHFHEEELKQCFIDKEWEIIRLETIMNCKTPFIFGVAKRK